MSNKEILRELGNGLIIRRAALEDTEALVAFNGKIHASPDSDEPDEYVLAWVRDLMIKTHPTFKPGDFTLAIDINTNEIVSSLNLIDQTWVYDGIEFGVGRPELVGTLPEYRRKGLIREQFDIIHQWSAERGHKVQGITGIPYYYRQFEYEMGLNLGGSRLGYLPHIPKLKDDEKEKFTFRPATPADITVIMQAYNYGAARNLISCKRDKAIWQYELTVKSEKTRGDFQIIENAEKTPVGFIIISQKLHRPIFDLWRFELLPGVSWLDVTPSVIRFMGKIGTELSEKNEKVNFEGFSFGLGAEHPAYDALPGRMPRIDTPYAWYVRVANLPDFLKHIGPVLEKRLADSPAVGHTGDLKFSFFRSGIKFSFEKGKLTNVVRYAPENIDDGDMMFPDLTFLRALFGHTSPQELENMFADCFPRNDNGKALTNFLFPKRASDILALS